MFEEDDDEMDGRFVVDEFEPLPRPMGDSPDYYIGFETEAEREQRLEKEAELAEEEFFREEREYNAKQAAKHEFDPLIFDRQLEKLRTSPSSAGVQLSLPKENACLTEEERNCVEWFDREDYDTFMKRSAWYPGGGWIVQYHRYVCDMMHLASEEVLKSPANDLLLGREILCRDIREGSRKDAVRKYEDMDRRERFLFVASSIFQAAEAGDVRAQNTIGCIYERGGWPELKEYLDKYKCGCLSSNEAAREWYRKSAAGGCVQGQRNYARVLMNGIGAEWGKYAIAERVAGAARDRKSAVDVYLGLAGRGDVKSQYCLACLFAEGAWVNKDISECAKWLRMAAHGGHNKAVTVVSAAGNDTSDERLLAELIILWQKERLQKDREGSDFTVAYRLPVDASHTDNSSINKLLKELPEGTVLPPSAGRDSVRIPNLKSANPSFAARLIILVRDRFGGDAPAIYRAAHVSRKTYSSIVGNELRPISKQTALAFALALRLPLKEACELLESAGFSLSRFYLEDIIVKACIIAGIHDIDRVNAILAAHEAKTFPSE